MTDKIIFYEITAVHIIRMIIMKYLRESYKGDKYEQIIQNDK